MSPESPFSPAKEKAKVTKQSWGMFHQTVQVTAFTLPRVVPWGSSQSLLPQ